MRIDKYLKLSRIIKRRSIAKKACDAGKVFINDVQAYPDSKVNVQDKLDVHFGSRFLSVRVLDIKEHVLKDDASNLYEVITDTTSENLQSER